MFIDVPSQQPRSELQKQQVIKCKLEMTIKSGHMKHTYNTDDWKLKLLISITYNIKLIIKTGIV